MEKLEFNLLSLEENGDDELEEANKVSPSSLPCGAFSIRNYVAGVRKVDIKKCWPFSPQFLEIKLQKGVDNILPPLVAPTCRYWQCAECVENAVTPDYSNQERDAHKQFDALHSDVLIQSFGNLCTEQLGKEEHISDYIETSVLEATTHSILEYGKADEKNAECHVSEDIGSGKTSFVCSKNTFHSGDGGAEETKTLQLTGNEIFISLTADALHQSHSDCKTVFNNAASSPTDSELIPPGCRNVCENSNALADEVASERTAEKAEVFPHASTTMDSVEKYRTVNRSDHEDEDDRNTKTERQHFINDNLDRVPCKLIAGCNIDKDDYLCTSLAGCNDNMDDRPTQLSANTGNEESMQKVKKIDSKPLKENGKTQKKRLLADLIATAPSQQIKWDSENQNQASENSPRKARFGTWNKKSIRSQNSFKNGMHGWKEDICEVPSSMLTSFVPEKSYLESLEMIRKHRRLGIGAKSSSSKKFRQETSSPDEEGLVTNSSQRLQIDDLAMGLKKGNLVQKSISDEIQETKAAVESDDDLMDLAGFLAQKQLERISSFPSSGLPKHNHFRHFQKIPSQNKQNHVLGHEEELSEQVQLQPNSPFTEGLVRRQDALRNSPDQAASEKAQPCIVVEQEQEHLVQVNDSVVPEELIISSQGQKESIIIAKRDRKVSVSKDNSNCTGKACVKKLHQDGKSDASTMLAKESCEGYSTSQMKNSMACELKKPNVSPKHGNGSMPSQAIPEHSHLYSSAESKYQQNQLLDSHMQEKSIMSKQTKGMMKGHRVKCASFVTRKGGNNKRYCASKRVGSATQKSLKKLKLYSNHDLTGEQNTSTHIIAAEAPSDDYMHLESEGACHQRDQVESFLVSGQATEVSDNSTGNEVFSESNDSSGDRKWLTVKNSSHRRKNVNFLSMTGTKKKGSSASQCKPIAASVSGYGISSGSDTMPTIDKESILRFQPTSSIAMKKGKGSSILKRKNPGTKKHINGRNLSPNQATRTQVALNHNLAGFGSEDGQEDTIAGESQEMNPNEDCLMQENTVMARGDDVTCSKVGDGIILHSRDSLDIPMQMGESKTVRKSKAARRVSMSKRNDEGSSKSQRKRSTGKISIKERKDLAKPEARQMSIIEETNAALKAAFSNGNARTAHFAATFIRDNGHRSHRNLNSGTCKYIPPEAAKAVNCKGLAEQQTLIQPSVKPPSKNREEVIIIDDSVQLTVSSEGIVVDSSKMSCRTFESENFNKKDENVNTRTPVLKPVSINEPEREPWHASVDSPVQPIGQKSLIQNADARLVFKSQDAPEHDNSLVQSHGNAFSNDFEKQSSSNATCLPAKGFLGSRISQDVLNSSGSCNSLGSLLPHVNLELTTPSTASAPEFNKCSSSNHRAVFRFARGNQVNIPTKLSQETSWHSNYNLNLHIQDRINAHTTNWDSGYEVCKQNASVTMDGSARKHSGHHQTITKNMLGSSSARTITGFEALDSDPVKQSPVETMTSHGKVETNQRIEKISYINKLTNARQVPQANQNVQTTTIPLTKTGSVAKIEDSASKQTMQSEYVQLESSVDVNNLTLCLASNTTKDQKFRRKRPIVTGNVTDLMETRTQEADISKQLINSMHDNTKAVLTSQTHTSLMPTPLKRLKLAPGHMNFLNIPSQRTKQHIPIYSTFPSISESTGGKYFQDGLKTYSDQYGGLIRTSDESFQMGTRTHCNISNASETASVSKTQENVRTDVSKGLYGRAGINCFLRPGIGAKEVSGRASDKERSILTSVCKDSSLELTLSIQHESDQVKQL